jgi:hypothetical protein
VVWGAEVLPHIEGDAVIVQPKQELFTKNRGEGQGDVPKENVGREAEVCVPVLDERAEGINGIERLQSSKACAL